MSNRLVELEIYHVHLPFRRTIYQGHQTLTSSDSIVIAALLADGTVGYGEGVIRKGIGTDSAASINYHFDTTIRPLLNNLEPKRFSDLLDFADQLPFSSEEGQQIHTVRCAVELALLDAYAKYFDTDIASINGWLGFGEFMHSDHKLVQVSGLLNGSQLVQIRKELSRMRWWGLRDFKLDLGTQWDEELSMYVADRLFDDLLEGLSSFRVDAHGSWDIDRAVEMSEKLANLGVCIFEDPLALDDQSHWQMIADLSHLSVMVDQALVSLDDANYFIENDLVDYLSISINKNGGLIAALRIAEAARKNSRGFGLSAEPGESSLLTAAGVKFLQMVQNTEFAEIGYVKKNLKTDLATQHLNYGYRGKLKLPKKSGFGVEVRRDKIQNLLSEPPRKIAFA